MSTAPAPGNDATTASGSVAASRYRTRKSAVPIAPTTLVARASIVLSPTTSGTCASYCVAVPASGVALTPPTTTLCSAAPDSTLATTCTVDVADSVPSVGDTNVTVGGRS